MSLAFNGLQKQRTVNPKNRNILCISNSGEIFCLAACLHLFSTPCYFQINSLLVSCKGRGRRFFCFVFWLQKDSQICFSHSGLHSTRVKSNKQQLLLLLFLTGQRQTMNRNRMKNHNCFLFKKKNKNMGAVKKCTVPPAGQNHTPFNPCGPGAKTAPSTSKTERGIYLI